VAREKAHFFLLENAHVIVAFHFFFEKVFEIKKISIIFFELHKKIPVTMFW